MPIVDCTAFPRAPGLALSSFFCTETPTQRRHAHGNPVGYLGLDHRVRTIRRIGSDLHTKVTVAPSLVKPHIADRATREWSTSPTMATFNPAMRAFRWRTVNRSSSPWVGCSCTPSPALMTAHRTDRLATLGAPAMG